MVQLFKVEVLPYLTFKKNEDVLGKPKRILGGN